MIKKSFLPFVIAINLFVVNINGQINSDSIIYKTNLESFSNGNNFHRYKFIKQFTKADSSKIYSLRTESIDWFGIYRNVVFEKKGESDSIVYIVCHYDKIDGNILSSFNALINGSLDIVLSNIYLSKGAYDNGTGVIIGLNLLSNIMHTDMHYTYRFLFAGMEEFGLRGSRRHVSGLKRKEWKKVIYAINIDMVGMIGTKGISITENVSDKGMLNIASEVAKAKNYLIKQNKIPIGASSDFLPFQGQSFAKDFSLSLMFNIVGSLIPQRSYFTSKKDCVPVINFTDSATISSVDYLSGFSPISFGHEHSYKDKLRIVDVNNLIDYVSFITYYIEYIDKNRITTPNTRS